MEVGVSGSFSDINVETAERSDIELSELAWSLAATVIERDPMESIRPEIFGKRILTDGIFNKISSTDK